MTKSTQILKQLILTLTISVTYISPLPAEDYAEIIGTTGKAQLERVSNFLLFSTSKKISIRVPELLRAGDSIQYQFEDSGKTVSESFPVVDIAIRGDLCWLHSKSHSPYDLALGNTIYVQPCRKVR